MAHNNDDFQLQSYQDDLTTDDNAVDPLMTEETEDPTKELGVPADKFGEELSKEFDDEDEVDDNNVDIHDDERENIEDLDDESLGT